MPVHENIQVFSRGNYISYSTSILLKKEGINISLPNIRLTSFQHSSDNPRFFCCCCYEKTVVLYHRMSAAAMIISTGAVMPVAAVSPLGRFILVETFCPGFRYLQENESHLDKSIGVYLLKKERL